MNTRRAGLALAGLLSAAALAGCVVVEERPARTSRDASASLPDGPIARPPVGGMTVNSRVVAAVTPVGSVPFDGQVLPLVSPDGRSLATQVGEAPRWATLLADRSAGVPARTRVEVYDLTTSPPRARRFNARLPAGLLLGRSCDERGFLVESPRPDGARWIGRVDWATGDLEWLVRDGAVNAFGALVPDGLAYCARAVGDDAFALVLGDERLEPPPGGTWLFPIPGADDGLVHALVADRDGVEVRSLSTGFAGADPSGAPVGVFTIARRFLSASGAPVVAYQASDPVRGGPVAGRSGATPPGVLLFSPGARRMAVFDPGMGAFTPLAARSIAGAWAPDGAGWALLVTTPEGLMFQRLEERGGRLGGAARVEAPQGGLRPARDDGPGPPLRADRSQRARPAPLGRRPRIAPRRGPGGDGRRVTGLSPGRPPSRRSRGSRGSRPPGSSAARACC